jgi:hypothetical protein
MVDETSFVAYQDFGMERAILIDEKYHDVFKSKMNEVCVLGRLLGYEIQTKQIFYYAEEKKRYDYDLNLKFIQSNSTVFMLNFFSSCKVNDENVGCQIDSSSIHFFHKKRPEDLVAFKRFFNSDLFKYGHDWVEIKSVELVLIALVIFKHALNRLTK